MTLYKGSYWQCEAYRQIANAGYIVIPEYRIGNLWADLAVMKDDQVALLVEAKGPRSRFGWPGRFCRQYEKYRATGFEFMLVKDDESMQQVLQRLKEIFDPFSAEGPAT